MSMLFKSKFSPSLSPSKIPVPVFNSKPSAEEAEEVARAVLAMEKWNAIAVAPTLTKGVVQSPSEVVVTPTKPRPKFGAFAKVATLFKVGTPVKVVSPSRAHVPVENVTPSKRTTPSKSVTPLKSRISFNRVSSPQVVTPVKAQTPSEMEVWSPSLAQVQDFSSPSKIPRPVSSIGGFPVKDSTAIRAAAVPVSRTSSFESSLGDVIKNGGSVEGSKDEPDSCFSAVHRNIRHPALRLANADVPVSAAETQVESSHLVRRVAWKPLPVRRLPRPALQALNVNVLNENAPSAHAPKVVGGENNPGKSPAVRRKPVPIYSPILAPCLAATRMFKSLKVSVNFPDMASIDSFPMRDGLVRTKAIPIGSCSDVVTRVRHMDLMQVLGRGSFGKVYLVRGKNGKLQALKVINKEQLGPRPEMVFLEQDLLKRLRGARHLLNMVGSFHDSCNFYLVTDFYPGGDLEHHIKRVGALKTADARFYAAEILCGLSHLHSQGIFHRDLKPANVLIQQDGHVCIADFGLCRDFGSSAVPSEDESFDKDAFLAGGDPVTVSFVGTPGYMSPEALTREHHSLEADIWSFGVCVYQLLQGQSPWWNQGNENFITLVTKCPLQFNDTVDMDPDAKAFIEALLLKDLYKRLTEIPLIKKHSFFATVDFKVVADGHMLPPFIPETFQPVNRRLNFWEGIRVGISSPTDIHDVYPAFTFTDDLPESGSAISFGNESEVQCPPSLTKSPFARPCAPEPPSPLNFGPELFESSDMSSAEEFIFERRDGRLHFLGPKVEVLGQEAGSRSPGMSSSSLTLFRSDSTSNNGNQTSPASSIISVEESPISDEGLTPKVEADLPAFVCNTGKDADQGASDEPPSTFFSKVKKIVENWAAELGKKLLRCVKWVRDSVFGRPEKEGSPV